MTIISNPNFRNKKSTPWEKGMLYLVAFFILMFSVLKNFINGEYISYFLSFYHHVANTFYICDFPTTI